ncbi:hypothetical protein JCM8547_007650 [Rhodosporidiobolus lusitaniae]
MSYSQPRPYKPHELHSPSSFDSLAVPPHPQPHRAYTDSLSGQSSPASASDGVEGAFATLQGQGRRGRPQQGRQEGSYAVPPPPVRQGQGEKGHLAFNLGGTGVVEHKENPAHKRKRIILMCICGLVVLAIIALTVAGCKGLL